MVHTENKTQRGEWREEKNVTTSSQEQMNGKKAVVDHKVPYPAPNDELLPTPSAIASHG